MNMNPTAVQNAILRLLYTHHSLTTPQLWQALYPDRPKKYTERELTKMSARCWIKADTTSRPYVWILLRGGADVLGVQHGSHFYRRSPDTEIAYRGAILALERQLIAAGWEFLAPQRYGPAHRKPPTTRQAGMLMEALEARETLLIQQIAGDPIHPDRAHLAARRDRLASGALRQLVPPSANDYVIYHPTNPAVVAVIIPHPPKAGRAFWLQKPASGASTTTHPARPGRVPLYSRLVEFIPICAAIPNPAEFSTPLKDAIKTAGFSTWELGKISTYLAKIGSTAAISRLRL